MSGLFIHMPKCAGASVRALLESGFPGQVEFSYESYFRIPLAERLKIIAEDMETPVEVTDKTIVYGHYFPVKYLGKNLNPSLKLTTILRDPLERMRSHYIYWNSGVFEHYLCDKMKAERWSFTDFAFSAEMQNFYAQYSINVPVERYDYIGIYENLQNSVKQCLATIGLDLPPDFIVPHKNGRATRDDDLLSTIDREAFKQWHAEDYALYEAAKQRFHSA